ncbi:Uncharacterised protein [Clostridium tetani]|uniref:hypothetical protein n=1 Tax=Clostridium tetani TaxID=1513 RepID=UPI000D222DE1|nr:hypothetical protein [Clostridium tetani]AVP54507.1 hypothetical protein C3B72_04955 [Clostridium tetani]RXI75226.1 hypothetical protein DP128_11750 [Clostridium tetani]WFN62902.1 hypothetical protein PAA20_05495 [Clostridium tetani]SUY55109.1 Uncharacterised protein [Clostridium tetani]BDR83506.1 hypothetical protein K254310026_09170 [Clostridium tetani]
MKKIITENPKNMIEHMHNFVFVKNKEVYVRLGNNEVSLVEYIREMDKKLYGIEHDESYCNAEWFGECMDDDRFTCTMYHALVGFAEVREKLKYYEESLGDTTVEEIIETIARNCVAWDTSKDKREGLLPEVAVFRNPSLYKRLISEEYCYLTACKKFDID